VSLTLLFTDIVDSTDIGIKLGDSQWVKDLFVHFTLAKDIASCFDSYVVKVIGDSLMIAFKTPSEAVNFALNFGENTGIEFIGIRVGINCGEVQIKENDIYGLNVNLTSRIQHSIPLEGIWVSNSVKRDYEKTLGLASGVIFTKRKRTLKSFGEEELWKARTASWFEAIKSQREARRKLLGTPRVPSWII
jgi:class 3 adenylate cyclase